MWRQLCLEWLKERHESRLQAALTQRRSKRTVRQIRFPPHVSGYFWIRNFFFPDTTSGFVHPTNSTANPDCFSLREDGKIFESGKKTWEFKNIRIPCGRDLNHQSAYFIQQAIRFKYLVKILILETSPDWFPSLCEWDYSWVLLDHQSCDQNWKS